MLRIFASISMFIVIINMKTPPSQIQTCENEKVTLKYDLVSDVSIDDGPFIDMSCGKRQNLGGYMVYFEKGDDFLSFNLKFLNEYVNKRPEMSDISKLIPNFEIYYTIIDNNLEQKKLLDYSQINNKITGLLIKDKPFNMIDLNNAVPSDSVSKTGVYCILYLGTSEKIPDDAQKISDIYEVQFGSLRIPRQLIADKCVLDVDKTQKQRSSSIISTKTILIKIRAYFKNNVKNEIEEHVYVLSKSFAYIPDENNGKVIIQKPVFENLSQIFENHSPRPEGQLLLNFIKFTNIYQRELSEASRIITPQDFGIIENKRYWRFNKLNFRLLNSKDVNLTDKKISEITYSLYDGSQLGEKDILSLNKEKLQDDEIVVRHNGPSLIITITRKFVSQKLDHSDGKILFFWIKVKDDKNNITLYLSCINTVFIRSREKTTIKLNRMFATEKLLEYLTTDKKHQEDVQISDKTITHPRKDETKNSSKCPCKDKTYIILALLFFFIVSLITLSACFYTIYKVKKAKKDSENVL